MTSNTNQPQQDIEPSETPKPQPLDNVSGELKALCKERDELNAALAEAIGGSFVEAIAEDRVDEIDKRIEALEALSSRGGSDE